MLITRETKLEIVLKHLEKGYHLFSNDFRRIAGERSEDLSEREKKKLRLAGAFSVHIGDGAINVGGDAQSVTFVTVICVYTVYL